MTTEVLAAASSARYDPKAADMWSIGIGFFILLTGNPPWETASCCDPRFHAVFPGIDSSSQTSRWELLPELLAHQDETVSIYQLRGMTVIRNLLKTNPKHRWTATELCKYLMDGQCSS